MGLLEATGPPIWRQTPECWGSWHHHKHITNTPTWSKRPPFLMFCGGAPSPGDKASYQTWDITSRLALLLSDCSFLSLLLMASNKDGQSLPVTTDAAALKEEVPPYGGRRQERATTWLWFQCGNEAESRQRSSRLRDENQFCQRPLLIMLKTTPASQACETWCQGSPLGP